jgi:hypothetical protein
MRTAVFPNGRQPQKARFATSTATASLTLGDISAEFDYFRLRCR